MQSILVKGNKVVGVAPKITFGIYDEPFEKWRLADENDIIMYYMIDNSFTLVENITLPSDYEDGKYFFENGEFVLNEEWKPFAPTEKRLDILEEENKRLTQENLDSVMIEADLLYELSLLQLGLV